MGDYGIKVTIPGKDVFTATDPLDFALKTDMNLLKVMDYGTLSLSTGSNEKAHNLGYVPLFFVYGYSSGGGGDDYILLANSNKYWYPFDFAVGDWLEASVDTSKLYVSSGSAHGTSIVSCFYYIFYEAA